MKNILITSNCLVKGDPVEKGTIINDVDTSTAAELMSSGRATLAPKTEAPKKKAAKKSPKKKAAKTDES
jgi:phage/plasmid primase-like uncharacterized protein